MFTYNSILNNMLHRIKMYVFHEAGNSIKKYENED
ncbi:unknown [Roseburia sp. CAG:100]|nr:unknown [Roseburia sp. CAG:100]